MTTIKYEDLSAAYDFVNAAPSLENEAFVSMDTGAIHWISHSGVVDLEDPPDDFETSDRYIPVPHKNDYNLGRNLVFRFADEHLPECADEIRMYFRRRGAYSKFKALLDAKNSLEKWYTFEAEATDWALRQWCEANEIQLAEGGGEDLHCHLAQLRKLKPCQRHLMSRSDNRI